MTNVIRKSISSNLHLLYSYFLVNSTKMTIVQTNQWTTGCGNQGANKGTRRLPGTITIRVCLLPSRKAKESANDALDDHSDAIERPFTLITVQSISDFEL